MTVKSLSLSPFWTYISALERVSYKAFEYQVHIFLEKDVFTMDCLLPLTRDHALMIQK